MEQKDIAHFMYMPLTGLGLYGGHRGNRWLRNRITIFKQFVVPSLLKQSNQNFILWISARHIDRGDFLLKELEEYLQNVGIKAVFTYAGVCFWDDKYPDNEAHVRLINALHNSAGELINVMGEAKEVLMTIQPSDDCYWLGAVADIQTFFANNPDVNVYGYKAGYVMDYLTKDMKEWNPSTTPPFYTIRFPREIFIDPLKHAKYTGPYKSHEYVKDFQKAVYTDWVRGFLVGTHGENISTVFNHPFAGNRPFDPYEAQMRYGVEDVPALKLPISIRKKIMRRLPHKIQRKLRYLFGERGYARFYAWIRS